MLLFCSLPPPDFLIELFSGGKRERHFFWGGRGRGTKISAAVLGLFCQGPKSRKFGAKRVFFARKEKRGKWRRGKALNSRLEKFGGKAPQKSISVWETRVAFPLHFRDIFNAGNTVHVFFAAKTLANHPGKIDVMQFRARPGRHLERCDRNFLNSRLTLISSPDDESNCLQLTYLPFYRHIKNIFCLSFLAWLCYKFNKTSVECF